MSVIAEYADISTWHGVKDFYRSWNTKSYILKIFWFLVLIGAFAAVVYYNYMLVLQYLTYSTASKITPTKVDKMHFPNITIASTMKLNKTYIVNSQYIPPMYAPYLPLSIPDMKLAFVRYMNLLTYDMLAAGSFYDAIVEPLEKMYQNTFNKSVNATAVDLIPYVKNASIQCQHFLKHCWFDSTNFSCCSSNKSVFGEYGAWYQLKLPSTTVDNLAYQIRPGITGGLKVITEMDVNHMLLSQFEIPYGLRVTMTDYATPFEFSPVMVPAGMHALIRLSAQKFSLDPTIRLCLQNPDNVLDSPAYTKELCQSRCLLNMTLETCGCRSFTGFIFADPKSDVCTPLQMLTCVIPILTGGIASDQESMAKSSSCMTNSCPRLCEYWVYSPSVTYNKMTQSNNSNITHTGVSIFYGDLSYHLFEEALLMDFNTFVSNIGNICGLYTGISILSLVQCVAVFLFGPCRNADRKID